MMMMMVHDGAWWITCRTQCRVLRMARYASQAKKGKVSASPEVIKLWGSDAGRTMAVAWPWPTHTQRCLVIIRGMLWSQKFKGKNLNGFKWTLGKLDQCNRLHLVHDTLLGVCAVLSLLVHNFPQWNTNSCPSGKKLRALLYENDMSMEQVNLQIEREHIQECWLCNFHNAGFKKSPNNSTIDDFISILSGLLELCFEANHVYAYAPKKQENEEETLGGWKTESQLLLTPGWDQWRT